MKTDILVNFITGFSTGVVLVAALVFLVQMVVMVLQ